ncbi:hypothetical protein L596_006580 [Steinernema carpocapsae]|uniref:Uncharacterized protein n=1 Tax=Steinernema carpocapsae TaxID=34508 RepID=A0A4U8V2H4_STECR|nr:hypothetical protein L596_006580 [Steinernema carpocapsae]
MELRSALQRAEKREHSLELPSLPRLGTGQTLCGKSKAIVCRVSVTDSIQEIEARTREIMDGLPRRLPLFCLEAKVSRVTQNDDASTGIITRGRRSFFGFGSKSEWFSVLCDSNCGFSAFLMTSLGVLSKIRQLMLKFYRF